MDKKKFVLRIDEETMKSLEKWAADEFRSLNGQIEYILTNALKKEGRNKTQGTNLKLQNSNEKGQASK